MPPGSGSQGPQAFRYHIFHNLYLSIMRNYGLGVECGWNREISIFSPTSSTNSEPVRKKLSLASNMVKVVESRVTCKQQGLQRPRLTLLQWPTGVAPSSPIAFSHRGTELNRPLQPTALAVQKVLPASTRDLSQASHLTTHLAQEKMGIGWGRDCKRRTPQYWNSKCLTFPSLQCLGDIAQCPCCSPAQCWSTWN